VAQLGAGFGQAGVMGLLGSRSGVLGPGGGAARRAGRYLRLPLRPEGSDLIFDHPYNV
jgi:hypothetical protein